jgi:uncharacterized membrane protein
VSASAIAAIARIAFAASMMVYGVHAFVTRELAGIWGPVPKFIPAQAALPWLVGVVMLACGAGLLWRRTMPLAARVLLVWLLLWLVLARLAEAATAPGIAGYWSGVGETLVVAAAAWMLVAAGERGRLVARVMVGLALIPFGLAHFVYLKETASLVPAWLSAPRAWAMFTGGSYLAAAAALLAGVCARLAAMLATVQIGGFTVLVWLPILASGKADASAWSESVISLALTAAACVIAQGLRRVPSQCDSAPSSSRPVE